MSAKETSAKETKSTKVSSSTSEKTVATSENLSPLKNSPNLTNNQAGSTAKSAQLDSESTLTDNENLSMSNSADTPLDPQEQTVKPSEAESTADYEDSLGEADFEDEDFEGEDLEDLQDLEDLEDLESDELPLENEASLNPVLEVEAEYTVTDDKAGQRIDKLAAELFADHSRSQLQEWLKSGNLTVNGEVEKPKYRVKVGDKLLLQAKLEQHGTDEPEDIALDIMYEDDSVLVINKPVGMVVHPGAGNWTGTLVNGLLYHYPNQAHLPRAGLVHRIDKNTSGLLVIGKTKAAQMELQDQLRDKTVYRHYQCIVAGDVASLKRQRTIDAPIGRHRTQRTKMTVSSVGKSAVTHIMNITALNDNYSLLDVQLETGRTHQIRVHLSHIGHPIIGDDVYGNRQQLRAGLTPEQREAIQKFPRQALHAYQLGFVHPETGEDIEVTAPLPDDIIKLAEILSE